MKRANPSQQNPPAKKMPNAQTDVTSIVIDAGTALKINQGKSSAHELLLMARNDVWHKIHVTRGGRFDNETVLQSILFAVSPHDLIPVHYTVSGEDSSFLVRNCESAIKELCAKNLILRSTTGDVLLLTITLGFASIHSLKTNIRPLLVSVLTKRHVPERKELILDNLHRDPDLVKIVYCPLAQKKTLTSVLNIIAKDLPPIEYLDLRRNKLDSVAALGDTVLEGIKILDLRQNNILNAEDLSGLLKYNISELWLDENPLCENYPSPKRYTESIRLVCPSLTKLDGVYVGIPGTPIISPIYVKNVWRRKLVEQFLEHFFMLYDEKDRSILRGIYHHAAVYSMSINSSLMNKKQEDKISVVDLTKDASDEESKKEIAPEMALMDRNLMRKFTDPLDRLYYGEEAILEVLAKFPETQHFKEWFSYDLMHDDGDCLTISVNGIFRDKFNEKFVFNRTFVLVAGNENEYKITNDQNLIYCTLPEKLKFSENFEPKKYVNEMNIDLNCLSNMEKENLVQKFKKTTTVNEKYSKRFLDEADWDLRNAIVDFMHQYKVSCIPDRAFLK